VKAMVREYLDACLAHLLEMGRDVQVITNAVTWRCSKTTHWAWDPASRSTMSLVDRVNFSASNVSL